MVTLVSDKNDKVDSIKQEIRAFADYLPQIAKEDLDVFAERVNCKLNDINAMSRSCPQDRRDLIKFSTELCARELDQSCMHARSAHKPLGYAGDYQVIEWIYDCKADSPSRGGLWDKLFHAHPASQAVRNRKDFFCEVFASVCERTPAPRSVLDIACGPYRELIDAVERVGPLATGTHFHCVDIEEKAIAYSQDRVQDLEGLTFQWEAANVLRIRPSACYDLVWSAGLFDYLNDRLATLLLKRMWAWTIEGGICAVGNFHTHNPSRNYMEWCIDWCLIHRTEDDMRRLCRDAGIPSNRVEIAKEPLGVCVFVVAAK